MNAVRQSQLTGEMKELLEAMSFVPITIDEEPRDIKC
jgi:hypothetical protein